MTIDSVVKEIASDFTAEEKAIIMVRFGDLRKWLQSLPASAINNQIKMHEYNLAVISFISGLRYARKQTKLD